MASEHRAPCGHPGTPIIGTFVLCSVKCDGHPAPTKADRRAMLQRIAERAGGEWHAAVSRTGPSTMEARRRWLMNQISWYIRQEVPCEVTAVHVVIVFGLSNFTAFATWPGQEAPMKVIVSQ